jgi:outer membrane protein assembly factor BamB
MIQLIRRRRRVVWSAVAVVLTLAIAGGVTVAVLASGDGSAGTARVAERDAARRPAAGAPVASRTNARWSVPSSGGEPMGVTADAAGVIAVSYGDVQSLDAADGSPIWRAHIIRTPEVAPVRAAIDADIVAVPTSEGVTALARADGAVRWKARFATGIADADTTGPVALATAPDVPRLVLGTTEHGAVAAFNRASGALTWIVRFPGTIVTAPQVDATAGVAVVAWHKDGAEGHVRALDLATGATRWDVATMEKLAAPVAHAGLVLLSEGDNFSHARIRALDVATGAPRWETPVPKSFEWETEPAAAGDDYATVDHFGTVTVVDVATGAIRWQHADDWALVDTRVLLAGNTVAFHDFAGDLVMLDRTNGELRSVLRPAGSLVDVGTDGRVVVTAVGGFIGRRFEALTLL